MRERENKRTINISNIETVVIAIEREVRVSR